MQFLKLEKKTVKLLAALLFISVAVFILVASVKVRGSNEQIWVEAEDATIVMPPYQIADMDGASNGKGIVPIGSHKNTEGYVKYPIWIENDGEYIFWGRCFWPNVCANSVKLAMDNSLPVIFGENPITNQWHWIAGPTFNLKRGKHELIIWNDEQDARIDKFLLTSDIYYVPTGFGLSNDVYSDFQDDLIPDCFNFKTRELWKLSTDAENNTSLYLNKPGSIEEKVLLKISNSDFYLFRFAYKALKLKDNHLQVYLNYTNEANYCIIEFNDANVTFTHINNGKVVNSRQFTNNKSFIDSDYADVAIKKANNSFFVKLNGKKIFEYPNHTLSGNYVGFGSKSGNMLFDNIAILSDEVISCSENFHFTQFKAFTKRPEIAIDYFNRLKAGRANWWVYSGKWEAVEDGFETLHGIPTENNDATILFGDCFWQNYTVQAAAKINSPGDIGIIFNYQDSDNYYAFKWCREKGIWQNKICKYEKGVVSVLCEKEAGNIQHGSANWYKIQIRINNGSIKAYVDDIFVLEASDKTFAEGKAGFWTNSPGGAVFDDITITPSVANEETIATEKNYSLFATEESISANFADWIPSEEGVIQPAEIKGYEIFITVPQLCKDVLQTSKMKYKKWIKGNFEINLNSSAVPRDVDVIFDFEKGTKDTCAYQLMILNNYIFLKKNNRILEKQYISCANRERIAVRRHEKEWSVSLSDNKVFSYIDSATSDSTTFAFGYSGIGKGKFFIHHISIKQQL